MPDTPADRQPAKRRLRPSGGYRKLRSFQTTTLIYDGTVSFCRRFVSGYSRTQDQMIQAARSGRQNIAEGNRAGAVSTKSELKLTNVARASLEELLLDFEDYLRQNDLPLWDPNGSQAKQVRELGSQIRKAPEGSPLHDPQDAGDRARAKLYAPVLQHEDPAVIANSLICLIHQANYLLDQQLISMEQAFVEGGGFSEQLASARIAERRKKDRSDPTNQTDLSRRSSTKPDPTQQIPKCPICGELMALRTARQGKNEGHQFWGCTQYPDCKGTAPV
ncbi:four helix bundle suffix domain-containing protein [Coraliomargarita sp. SDUM461004]|uniref:Four helix bundle suffix domain-containing protein n=1 Tax=Thalassobacterium sedimentorum TaxID=3041258 RepID=A0ABU1ALV4_9BACT|nr:four helix bundle suffix domain-containing protein [Coraliomargarita sp. SDUM461004]MDQ8195785.1 four helix bundle suffix domain-containing protein [Coraliomargarita sp. SDUM461004]